MHFTVLLFLLAIHSLAADLKVVSYNIYFDDATGQVRYPQIAAHLKASNADVIALQEVTPTCHKFLKTTWLGTHYTFTPANPTGQYFNLTLTKSKPIRSDTLNFHSRMGRSAICVDIQHDSQIIRFINVHLESLDTQASQALRQEQTQSLKRLLTGHSVILGDFNYTITSPLYTSPPHGLTDAAVTFKANKLPTYDVANNPIAKTTAEPDEPSRRLDRFYHSSKIEATAYGIHKVFYSDHYPISLDLRISK